MTKEDKKLLLKDLCARQPYHTYVLVDYVDEYNVHEVLNAYHIIGLKHYTGDDGLINIKPYLLPMSSMTEEEVNYVNKKFFEKTDNFNIDDVGEMFVSPQPFETVYTLSLKYQAEYFDWLNAHHFDYRGLIEKGLAFEAPEDMYKN